LWHSLNPHHHYRQTYEPESSLKLTDGSHLKKFNEIK